MSGENWRAIESAQNPRFRTWNDLHDGRGIKKHGQYLLAGRKLVPEAIALENAQIHREIERFHQVIVCEPSDARELDIPAHMERFRVPRALFDKLDISGTNFPLLVGKVPDMPMTDLTRAPTGLELVLALGDPNNLGAMLRSAAAFGVRKIILMPEAAHPFHPKALRAGANAQMALTLTQCASWEALNGAKGEIVALDGAGEDMSQYKWPKDLRLVLGEEGPGLPDTLESQRLAIPTTGAVESLNAMAAASIALYAYYTSVD
jgi:TrmH family RNA methyltransferase